MLYLVDDDADYRFLVQQVFNLFLTQYPLRLFADGLELVQYAEQHADVLHTEPQETNTTKPGLIVLDVDMPKLNGMQTLERLKQHAFWRTIPVVMMSNRVETGFKAAAYQLRANAYIHKPMDLMELKDVMGQLCQQWLTH